MTYLMDVDLQNEFKLTWIDPVPTGDVRPRGHLQTKLKVCLKKRFQVRLASKV